MNWNAEEALKLLDRGYHIVLTQDGLGDITALAIPKGVSLSRGLREWREYDSYTAEAEACGVTDDDPEPVKMVVMRRSIFNGPDGRTGCGQSVAQALHCLTEKMVFKRLPKGDGTFHECPPKPKV